MMGREKKQDGAEGEDKAQNKPDKASANLGVQEWGGSAAGLSHQSRPTVHWDGWAFMTTHSPSHLPGIVTRERLPQKGHDFPVGGALQLRLTSKMLTSGGSARHTPYSWTATPPLKGNWGWGAHFHVYHRAHPHSAQWHAATHEQCLPWSTCTTAAICARYLAAQHHKQGPMAKADNCNIMMRLENKRGLEENQKAYKSNGEWNLPAI